MFKKIFAPANLRASLLRQLIFAPANQVKNLETVSTTALTGSTGIIMGMICDPTNLMATPCRRCRSGFSKYCEGKVDAPCFECARGIPHRCHEKAAMEDDGIVSSFSLVSGDLKNTVFLPLVAEYKNPPKIKDEPEDAVKIAQIDSEKQHDIVTAELVVEQKDAIVMEKLETVKEDVIAAAKLEAEQKVVTKKIEREDDHVVSSLGLVSGDLKNTVSQQLVAEYKKAAGEVIERAIAVKDNKEYGCKSGEASAVEHNKPSVATKKNDEKATEEENKEKKAECNIENDETSEIKEDVHIVSSLGLMSGDPKHTVYFPLVAEYKNRPEIKNEPEDTVKIAGIGSEKGHNIVAAKLVAEQNDATEVIEKAVAAKDTKEYGHKSGEISAVEHKKPSIATERKAEAEANIATKSTPLPLYLIASVAANKLTMMNMNTTLENGKNQVENPDKKTEREDENVVSSLGLVSGDLKNTVYLPLVAEYKKAAGVAKKKAEEEAEATAVKESSGRTLKSINPHDESIICEVDAASKNDVDKALKAARGAFKFGEWGKMNARDRGALIMKLADLMDQHKEELATIKSIDSGAVYTIALEAHMDTLIKYCDIGVKEGARLLLANQQILEFIKQSADPQKASEMNIAKLSESSLEFIKSKSKFVRDEVRLAKFWNQNILFKTNIFGRSFITELLAVDAAMEEENNEVDSISKAFQGYLKRVCHMKSLEVFFHDCYQISDIPSDIRKQKPLLMDPNNPYNDLLHTVITKDFQHFMEMFQYCAGVSFDMMSKRCKDIYLLFYPQPLLYQLRKKKKWIKPKYETYLISVASIDKCLSFNQITNLPLMPDYILRDPQGAVLQDDLLSMIFTSAGFTYATTKLNLYEMVMFEFLKTDPESFLHLVRSWSSDLYNISAIINVVIEHLLLDPGNSTSLQALATLYTYQRKYDMAMYLKLKHPDVFQLIRQHSLFSAIQDKIIALIELVTVAALKLFPVTFLIV